MSRRLALLLFHHRFVLAFNILTLWTIGRYSTTSRKYLGKRRLLLSSPFDPSSSWLHALGQMAECFLSANRQVCLAMLRLQLLHSFQPF
ncbi:hypothetical protein H5410_022368 [Solanum commersonii]|uniref:Uncharacterized protein n=1 Tax=Solanum commersonii TaxID=4109 RepID=A0A9J5ZGK3_SOLCO|nr:hypothetical protein H5410_022368 [Solanum commersonii]